MEYFILGLLVISVLLNWYELGKVRNLEEIVGQMLYDLGKKGVLDVEINEDD